MLGYELSLSLSAHVCSCMHSQKRLGRFLFYFLRFDSSIGVSSSANTVFYNPTSTLLWLTLLLRLARKQTLPSSCSFSEQALCIFPLVSQSQHTRYLSISALALWSIASEKWLYVWSCGGWLQPVQTYFELFLSSLFTVTAIFRKQKSKQDLHGGCKPANLSSAAPVKYRKKCLAFHTRVLN